MPAFDLTTSFGSRVADRLQNEHIIWLTTVRRDGTPQPTPVWFWWDGEHITIFSKPDQQKLRNIQNNATVALNFHTDSDGGNVVVITGTATIDEAGPSALSTPGYVEKYRSSITDINMTPESMAATYSVAIHVTPQEMRGF